MSDYSGPITKDSFPDEYYSGRYPGKYAKSNPLEKSFPPHPDGKPWAKCCRSEQTGDYVNCAFIDGRGEGPMTAPFFCAHRNDDGYLRVCAGWHAKHGKDHG